MLCVLCLTSYNYVEIMKTRVLLVLFISCFVLGYHEKQNPPPRTDQSRAKRNAAGALHIVTNHAQPIHADVKADSERNEKVTPPEHDKYEIKSLRKSLHLPQQTSKGALLTTIDIMRKISRGVTFIVLFITVLLEFQTIFW